MSRVALFPTPEPRCTDPFDVAAEDYEASDRFDMDAMEWVSDTGDLPADLLDLVRAHYRDSETFAGKVQDALDDIDAGTDGWW